MTNKGQIIPVINFPIVTLNSNGIVSSSPSEYEFTRWSKSVVNDRGYWSSLFIIDSSGIHYKINEVSINDYTNSFWGFDLFLHQTVYVSIKMELMERFSMEGAKSIFKNLAGKNEDYYDSAGIQYEDITKAIDEATSIKDAIRAMQL